MNRMREKIGNHTNSALQLRGDRDLNNNTRRPAGFSPQWGFSMKHLIFALSALAMLATAIPAQAGCNGTYHCTQGYNGKQVCSC
jgi:hypothetical protein